MVVVFAAVLRVAHSAHERSFLMSAFLGVITCRAMVRPFACASRKKSTRLLLTTCMFEKVPHFS
jgi:hypothetical protein